MKKLRYKIFLRCGLAMIAAVCVCAGAVFNNKNTKSVTASADVTDKRTIIIDAGHGGFDGGAVADDGTTEKDINLSISLTLYKFLKQNGFCVIMTRMDDTSTEDTGEAKISSKKKSDLNNRLKLMNDYPESVFVSIHLNKFTTSAASGSQVFYSDSEKAKELGEYIQKSIVNLIEPDNLRVNKKAGSSTFLLYNATVPAVIVECGFLSNKQELLLLKTKDYQDKLAFCIYCGIAEYFAANGAV